jgi:anion-transporting  ArsA/GET3 family ATPase
VIARTAHVVVCCGSGGVGKTTTSAALAVGLAKAGARVAVLTIDPARRLADALSVGAIGNTAVPVPVLDLPAGAGLDAMMLDAKRTFDDVVGRFASSPEARDRILSNHYYRFVSTRLAGSHEYMAMEKLYDVATSGMYDVVVLDTPPSRHALDFLAAPGRMANLMDEGVMRWLVLPASRGGWKMIERGSELLARVLRSMLGERTIGDIAEFFSAFQGLWDGFRERSIAVRALLASDATRFVLVTTPAPGARAEALQFVEVLAAGKMPFGGFLVNRCVTPPTDSAVPSFGDPPAGEDPARWHALVRALAAAPERRRQLVADQERALADLRAHAPRAALWRVPDAGREVHDLPALAELARHLPSMDALRAATPRG